MIPLRAWRQTPKRALSRGFVQNLDRRALSKLITLVESSLPAHQEEAQGLVSTILKSRKPTDSALRIGLSGPPGVGKSTFIEAFGLYLIDKGHKVAVLAVDPSSSKSGGSILGDKTRMIHLSKHPQAYVRPSPSRGTLGGVGKHTQEAILLCEEAGYDIILVETVGVGQSETVVEGLVDMYTLLVAPGVGDELQGIKKGTVELADMIIVNKADGAFAENANTTQYEYMSALRLLAPKPEFGWTPPVVKCSSITLQGVPRVWELMSVYFNTSQSTGEFLRRRTQQNEGWMWRMIHEKLEARFKGSPAVRKSVPRILSDLHDGQLTPYQASVQLLSIFDEESQLSQEPKIHKA